MRLMPIFFEKNDRKVRRPQSHKLRRVFIKLGRATAVICCVGAGAWYLNSIGWVAEKMAGAAALAARVAFARAAVREALGAAAASRGLG